jgi:hypothetical protein
MNKNLLSAFVGLMFVFLAEVVTVTEQYKVHGGGGD